MHELAAHVRSLLVLQYKPIALHRAADASLTTAILAVVTVSRLFFLARQPNADMATVEPASISAYPTPEPSWPAWQTWLGGAVAVYFVWFIFLSLVFAWNRKGLKGLGGAYSQPRRAYHSPLILAFGCRTRTCELQGLHCLQGTLAFECTKSALLDPCALCTEII